MKKDVAATSAWLLKSRKGSGSFWKLQTQQMSDQILTK